MDAEHRYNATFDAGITEAGCNAHGRRKMRDAEQFQPVLAAERGRFIAAWFDLGEEAQLAGLRGPALLSWRQERIAPLQALSDRALIPLLRAQSARSI